MNIENRIIELGLVLPAPRAPAFSYAAVSLHANLAWVSGQLPWRLDGSLPNGKLGAEISIEEGQESARCCVLNALSVLKQGLGSLNSVEKVIKLTGFVASATGFIEQPQVMDGASKLILDIFSERGKHARSAIGVAELPRGVPVEIEFVFAIKTE
jgi:enamine deaminase RidA (YjgF/YER057c/UK114 family)